MGLQTELGHANQRAQILELVIDADARDMRVEARADEGAVGRRHAEARTIVPLKAGIEIFGFHAPIRQKHPLGAAARRPADTRAVQAA